MGLPTQLSAIPRLNHCLYADDITLWTAGGSDGEIEETLQEAINAVVEYVEPRGLSCSSSKSELLIIRPATHRRTSQESTHPIMLEVKGHPIPCLGITVLQLAQFPNPRSIARSLLREQPLDPRQPTQHADKVLPDVALTLDRSLDQSSYTRAVRFHGVAVPALEVEPDNEISRRVVLDQVEHIERRNGHQFEESAASPVGTVDRGKPTANGGSFRGLRGVHLVHRDSESGRPGGHPDGALYQRGAFPRSIPGRRALGRDVFSNTPRGHRRWHAGGLTARATGSSGGGNGRRRVSGNGCAAPNAFANWCIRFRRICVHTCGFCGSGAADSDAFEVRRWERIGRPRAVSDSTDVSRWRSRRSGKGGLTDNPPRRFVASIPCLADGAVRGGDFWSRVFLAILLGYDEDVGKFGRTARRQRATAARFLHGHVVFNLSLHFAGAAGLVVLVNFGRVAQHVILAQFGALVTLDVQVTTAH
ncbi:hypothetical protein HPB52_025328 [Rhipicephalus sanguineus]|uniref:Tick transposon n=1 Tax=Rhipicephalus sanguineus TaxID=34632 RepID=A0A9D4TD78_RHISA|nr:hypothetical protein HPB52_025328 [Rhipicephalus sanguineus]